MRRILRVAGESAFALACAVVLVAALLIVLEHSGWLAERVRRQLVAELGPLAADATLGSVRLSWTDPAVEIEHLALGPDGSFAELEQVRFEFRFDGRPVLARVAIEGGRVRLSPELARAASAETEPVDDRAALPSLPFPVSVESLWIELAQAGASAVPIGHASLALEPDASGRPRLAGELRTAMREAADAPPLRIRGQLGPGGDLQAEASVRALDLESLALFEPLRRLGIEPAGVTGRGTIVLTAALSAEGRASVDLRARVERGSLDVGGLPRAVDDLALDVDLGGRADQLEGLFHLDAWSGRARGSCTMSGEPVSFRAALGDAARPGARFEAWIDAERHALDRERMEALRAWSWVAKEWEALEPRGMAAVRLAARVPAREDFEQSLLAAEFAGEVRFGGSTGMTLHGWREHDGERRGFPVPVEGVSGRLAFSESPGREQRRRLGLIALAGAIAGGEAGAGARCSGTLIWPPDAPRPEVDVDVHVSGMTCGPVMLDALRRGLPEAARVVSDFDPSGGRVSARVRVLQTPALRGVAAEGEIEFEDIDARWREIPVPMHALDGRVSLRWGSLWTAVERDGRAVDGYRPMGAAFEFGGRLDTAEALRIRGVVRAESLAQTAIDESLLHRHPVQEIEVAIDRLSFTGQDTADLALHVPEFGAQLDAYRPSGFADARWRGGRVHPSAPFRYDLEIAPARESARVLPELFPTEIRDVGGRLLVTGHDRDEAAGEGEQLDVRLTLAGTAAGGLQVAAHGTASSQGGEFTVHAAGVDPTNPALLGAFATAVASGGSPPSAPLSALGVRGRLDVDGVVSLGPRDQLAQAVYTVHLRGNDLLTEAIALRDVQGRLVLERGLLRGERLAARLGRTPLVLSRVRFLALEDLAALDPSEALDAPPGFVPERAQGQILLADVDAEDVSIDRETLEPLLGPEALAAVVERFGWEGHLAVRGARLALLRDAEGKSKLGLRGAVEVRAMSADLGLPVEIERASAALQSLVYEQGRLRFWGELSEVDGRLAGRRVEGAGLVLSYVDGRLGIDRLSGRFEDGTLSSLGSEEGGNAFALDVAEPYHFALALELSDCDVSGVLRGIFDSSIADRGRANARLRLAGRLDQPLGVQGSGSIELFDTRLWSIPAMRELFSRLGFDATATFDEMRCRFELRQGVIRMDPVQVHSPLLSLVGQGTLDLDGALSHDLEVRYSLIDKLGALNRVLYWIQNSLLRVEIRGDMARPQIWLRNALVDLFRSRDERRHVPLPAFAPLAARF